MQSHQTILMTSKAGQDSIVSVAHIHIPNINKQTILIMSKAGQDSVVSVAHAHIPNIDKQRDYGHQDIILGTSQTMTSKKVVNIFEKQYPLIGNNCCIIQTISAQFKQLLPS